MTIAIYPGTFDPITNGHLDVAIRAARLFEKVVVGVYDTPSKDLMFTTKERVDLARSSINGTHNIEIMPFSGLTVDFAKKVGALAIVRGLRIGADFEYEREMAMMNNKLSPGIEVVCLMASLKYQYLSSSRLKEVARLQGDIYDLVPDIVAGELKKRSVG
ncbi:MAG: pantetheine-phosphate adenylyltransferase [Dehalococcoidales bacterium]|nr:pantetheine-phosphate adenylyltransferase [Dehalococcoidales bacterium]